MTRVVDHGHCRLLGLAAGTTTLEALRVANCDMCRDVVDAISELLGNVVLPCGFIEQILERVLVQSDESRQSTSMRHCKHN